MTRPYAKIRERFADVFGSVLDAAGPESDELREASSALLDSHARLAAAVQQAPPVLQVRSDRQKFRPYGLHGGSDGASGSNDRDKLVDQLLVEAGNDGATVDRGCARKVADKLSDKVQVIIAPPPRFRRSGTA